MSVESGDIVGFHLPAVGSYPIWFEMTVSKGTTPPPRTDCNGINYAIPTSTHINVQHDTISVPDFLTDPVVPNQRTVSPQLTSTMPLFVPGMIVILSTIFLK